MSCWLNFDCNTYIRAKVTLAARFAVTWCGYLSWAVVHEHYAHSTREDMMSHFNPCVLCFLLWPQVGRRSFSGPFFLSGLTHRTWVRFLYSASFERRVPKVVVESAGRSGSDISPQFTRSQMRCYCSHPPLPGKILRQTCRCKPFQTHRICMVLACTRL